MTSPHPIEPYAGTMPNTLQHVTATLGALTIAVATGFVSLVATPSSAHACSLEQRPLPMRIVPGAREAEVPRNVVFSPPAYRGGLETERYFWTIDDAPVDLEVDEELTELLTFDEPYASMSTTVYRPVNALQPGDVISPCYRDDCGEERATVTDVVDETPPTRPTIDDVKLTLYDNPSRGPGTFCPELDHIRITLSSSDDTTPLELQRVLVFAGPTRGFVEELDTPDAAIVGEVAGDDESSLRIESWLGLDSDREAYHSPFSRGTNVCFTVALMDWAGNVSERSEIQCIDTTDPSDPRAVIVEGAGCGCSSGGTGERLPGAVFFLLVGIGLLRLRTHRHRP